MKLHYATIGVFAALSLTPSVNAAEANVTAMADTHNSSSRVTRATTSIPSVDANSTVTGSTAWASANLATGALRGSLQNNTYEDSLFTAGFGESFTFSIPGATDQTATRVYLQVAFDARMQYGQIDMLTGTHHSYYGGNFQQTRGYISFFDSTIGREALNYTTIDALGVVGSSSRVVKDPSGVSANFRQILALDLYGAAPTLSISSTVTGRTWFGGYGHKYVDFGNSAHFSFLTPQSVTYTSQSGYAFTNLGAVPEPSTWAMLILGFGMAGASMRRKNAPKLRVAF